MTIWIFTNIGDICKSNICFIFSYDFLKKEDKTFNKTLMKKKRNSVNEYQNFR